VNKYFKIAKQNVTARQARQKLKECTVMRYPLVKQETTVKDLY